MDVAHSLNIDKGMLNTIARAGALSLPALYFAWKAFVAFPTQPVRKCPKPSLAFLPSDSPHWKIYPEDFYGKEGGYAELPEGRVKYWLAGPVDGRKIVLIHGLSVPSMIWQNVVPMLTANGFRVLIYDLYGRGYTDAPDVVYDTNLYITQLALLMQHVRWDKAFIAGVSMGGAIAAAFTARFPSLVDEKLALVCPVGLMQYEHLSRQAKYMTSPIMGFLKLFGAQTLARARLRQMSKSKNENLLPHIELGSVQAERLPGYLPAIFSSVRHGPLRGLEDEYATVGRQSTTHVLLIWGDDDKEVPYALSAIAQKLIPQSRLITVPGGQHDITLSHPAAVGNALIDFFDNN